MFQPYGYDVYCANEYIDTNNMTPEVIYPRQSALTDGADTKVVALEEAKRSVPVRETLVGSNEPFIHMEMRRKMAEQRFQILCMWVLLAVCVMFIITLKNKEAHLGSIMYMLHMQHMKGQPPVL